jgi:hypothetical protein
MSDRTAGSRMARNATEGVRKRLGESRKYSLTRDRP